MTLERKRENIKYMVLFSRSIEYICIRYIIQ